MQIIDSVSLPTPPNEKQEFGYSDRFSDLNRPLKLLLIKPYQEIAGLINSPPLGLLYLISVLRNRFGSDIEIELLDMKLNYHDCNWMKEQIGKRYNPDIVGVSSLNYEAGPTHELARLFKEYNPDTITVLGGPYALHRAEEILLKTEFDWIVHGTAENSFPEAIARITSGADLGMDLNGLSYKKNNGDVHINVQQDNITQLDEIPFPAWDMVDFDHYAKQPNMMNMLKGKRYAPLFTSRGCPYLCNYCHDIFTKKFVYRSPENVLAEIELLYEKYGVDEFEIVDDIFNLHKPRLKAIMSEVARRWPDKLSFSFPNGLRADILDDDVLDALQKAGTYAINLAVETVTPRLQVLMEKHLDIEKTQWAIEACSKRGIMTGGFFMLGFPTETEEELKSTIDFALKSKFSIAHFFIVVPQKETPMYDIALIEGPEVLLNFSEDAEGDAPYYSPNSWYQKTYGIPLNRYLAGALLRFYLSPSRIWRIWNTVPKKSIFKSALKLAGIFTNLKS